MKEFAALDKITGMLRELTKNMVLRLLFSHLSPHWPEGQRHLPVDGSHDSSSAQLQDFIQFNPKLPFSHSTSQKENTHTNISLLF